jgi:hypothetical protein
MKPQAARVLKKIGNDRATLELIVEIAELFLRRRRKKRLRRLKRDLTPKARL